MRALVAATGAVIVVLSMAMDPFTQQILSFPTAPTNVTNSTAEIASAQGFGLPFGDLDGTKGQDRYISVNCLPRKGHVRLNLLILVQFGLSTCCNYKRP